MTECVREWIRCGVQGSPADLLSEPIIPRDSLYSLTSFWILTKSLGYNEGKGEKKEVGEEIISGVGHKNLKS